jgi:hypothetical protein
MRGGLVAPEAPGRQGNEQRWPVLTEEEKADVMRIIDEYDFVSKVRKYKATIMPEDLLRELVQQNDIARDIIAKIFIP